MKVIHGLSTGKKEYSDRAIEPCFSEETIPKIKRRKLNEPSSSQDLSNGLYSNLFQVHYILNFLDFT